MRQQSQYVRYGRNWFGLSPNSSNPAELYLQTKKTQIQDGPDFSISANIYLQSLKETEPAAGSSGKKQRKIKVFGIPENRIRKDEPIPQLFGSAPGKSDNDETDQMLIDSHLQIPTTSLIEEPSGNNDAIYDQNQLQKLLYFSGSSASLPLGEPLAQSNRAESIRTDEIDRVLQLELPVKETEKQFSSISPSRVSFPIKNTDSAYLSEEFKLKEQQNSKISDKNSFVLKALKEEEMSKEVSRSIQQQIIQKSNRNSQILHISNHLIIDHQPTLEFNAISPIPIKYEEMLQASVDYDQPKESKMSQQTIKHQMKISERPYLPLSTKAEKVPKGSENLNIKNYFQSYGSYQTQIQKMINKLQKVSDLKDKEKVIKRELQTLTHKKHQSVDNIEHESKSKPKSHKQYKPDQTNQRIAYNQAFTQSASHFLPSRQPETLPRNSLDRELHQDVAKVERIINIFKEISQVISTEGNLDQTGLKYHHERSQKNLRAVNHNNHMMFQSEKFAIDSLELPNYSCKKTNSQPQIQLKIPEKMHGVINDSQQIQSDNYTYKGMDAEPTNRNAERPSIMPYCTNTVRTEKKPLHGLVERCQSKYNYDLHTQKKCECSHAKLVQEVAKLTQKVQDLEKEKIREARSLDDTSQQKHKSIESNQRSIHEQSSCVDLLPRQIQESIQSIKAKTGKPNPHLCSNLQSVSILKPASTLKQHKSILKSEQIRPSPTLTKRKTSKDLPPKPTNVSKSPQMKKDAIKENQFSEQINIQSLKICFPSIICCLTHHSSESAIIKFGQTTYCKLFAFATSRLGVKGAKLEQKTGFKIKKYEDCIHYYLQNTLNYHLVCYFKGKLYFGQLKDPNSDCKHGFGYYSTPKYVYEGQFSLDKKSGKGKINYSNGDIYQGEWCNGKRQGHGVMVNLAGDIFCGTFRNGKKNGKGEERLKNGDFYRGEFKDGKLDGEGIYWWSDGSVYQGGFKGGLLHGRGVWRSKENDCYEGQYRQNKKYGKGIYKWSNGMIFSGVFEADQQVPLKNQALVSPDRKNSKSGQRTMRTRQNSTKKV